MEGTLVKPRVLRRIKQLSNHSTPRSYRSIIQSQHNTSYFEIKAGLKALEFGVMFSFATDNCVLSVVFSSVVFYAFLRFSFWLCGCFLFSCFVSIFRLGAVALCVRHWVCVGGVGGCAHPLSLPWLSAVMALRFCLVIVQAGNLCRIVTLCRRLPDLNAVVPAQAAATLSFFYFCSHVFPKALVLFSRNLSC